MLQAAPSSITPEKCAGMFRPNHPRLAGIRWGNWGSRPYEYFWASKVVSIENKRVIDLGVGLPSQYNWYAYAATELKPSYYVGIDADERIKQEILHGKNFDILHMNMADLSFADKEFDYAFCISTFEHIPYPAFMKSIQEAHRVLKDDGLLVITLDEQWNKNAFFSPGSSWNDLEHSLVKEDLADTQSPISLCLPDFLHLIHHYFVLANDDLSVNLTNKTITSSTTGATYYQRSNRDQSVLHSYEACNSCVSFAVLKKVASCPPLR
jgi:SAM-dependent methyltransferase